MPHSIQKLSHVHSIDVSLAAWHFHTIFVDTFKDFFWWNYQCFTIFSVVSFCLSKVNCVFVFENFEVFTFNDFFNLEILLNWLISFQVIDVLLLFRNRKQTGVFIDKVQFFILFLMFWGLFVLLSCILAHFSLSRASETFNLRLFFLPFEKLKNSVFIFSIGGKSIC